MEATKVVNQQIDVGSELFFWILPMFCGNCNDEGGKLITSFWSIAFLRVKWNGSHIGWVISSSSLFPFCHVPTCLRGHFDPSLSHVMDARDWLLLENEIGCGLKAKLQRGLTSQWTFSFSRERVVREMGLKFSHNYPSLRMHVECTNSASNSIRHGKTFTTVITEPLGSLSMTHESETCESKKVYWLSESDA